MKSQYLCIFILIALMDGVALAQIRDVFPIYTERQFDSLWQPDSCWNPYLDHKKAVSEITPLFHVYTGSVNTGENETGKLDLKFAGSEKVPVPEGKYCLHFIPKEAGAIAGMTYKHTGIPSTTREHGSSKYEEYVCDFSTYREVGRFYFRYWLEKGAKYKIMAKVDSIQIVGTGQWEDAIIQPLGRQIHTHHTLFWMQNRNKEPVDLYIDDAFFFKGELPDDVLRANEMRKESNTTH